MCAELEPIRFKLPELSVRRGIDPDPARPEQPAIRGQFRQSGRQAGAARCRGSNGGDCSDVAVRFAPEDLRQAAVVRVRQVAPGQGLRLRQGLFRVPHCRFPPRSPRPTPRPSITCSRRRPRPSDERVDWPERVNRQDYPQTDAARPWTLDAGRDVQRPPDREADAARRPGRRPGRALAPGPASSTAATASWLTD